MEYLMSMNTMPAFYKLFFLLHVLLSRNCFR